MNIKMELTETLCFEFELKDVPDDIVDFPEAVMAWANENGYMDHYPEGDIIQSNVIVKVIIPNENK